MRKQNRNDVENSSSGNNSRRVFDQRRRERERIGHVINEERGPRYQGELDLDSTELYSPAHFPSFARWWIPRHCPEPVSRCLSHKSADVASAYLITCGFMPHSCDYVLPEITSIRHILVFWLQRYTNFLQRSRVPWVRKLSPCTWNVPLVQDENGRNQWNGPFKFYFCSLFVESFHRVRIYATFWQVD